MPGTGQGAEDSKTKVVAPVIKKRPPMRVRPIKTEHYMQNGEYHDRSFQMKLWEYKIDISEESVREGFMEEIMPV